MRPQPSWLRKSVNTMVTTVDLQRFNEATTSWLRKSASLGDQ